MANVSDFVIPRFHPVLGDVMTHGHTHYWLHGGRGSTKSSFISIAIVLLVIANPKANAVVVRRFGNTLRDSVYQQLLWAIETLGLEGVFRTRISPMEITYTPTGQRIVFRGADDPLKLKRVKFTLMRNIARHEHALEVSLTGISHAVLHCARTFGESLPDEGSVAVSFDDSIIADTAAEKRLSMEEVGITLHPYEYRMRFYGEDETTTRERAEGLGKGAKPSA